MDVEKNDGDRAMLSQRGWGLVDPLAVSTDSARYRDYIRHSLGEFSVAKDLNVRLATGWFSDRSACYLAAGRPVVVQDTGFRGTLPTGAGLLTFLTMHEAVEAVRTVVDDWPLHSAAARRIAERYFAARSVLAEYVRGSRGPVSTRWPGWNCPIQSPMNALPEVAPMRWSSYSS